MKKGLCIMLLGVFCILALPALMAYQGHGTSAVAVAPLVPERTPYSIVGAPTISVAAINRVLCAPYQGRRSTACGTGAALYRLGVQYGIDPVFALAFFQHESAFGTQGVAVATLSLGNIRCTSGYRCQEGYRAYATWAQGYADWYRLMLYGYVKGAVSRQCPCLSVEQIIPVYAPASDRNDEATYIHDVEASVALWRQASPKAA